MATYIVHLRRPITIVCTRDGRDEFMATADTLELIEACYITDSKSEDVAGFAHLAWKNQKDGERSHFSPKGHRIVVSGENIDALTVVQA